MDLDPETTNPCVESRKTSWPGCTQKVHRLLPACIRHIRIVSAAKQKVQKVQALIKTAFLPSFSCHLPVETKLVSEPVCSTHSAAPHQSRHDAVQKVQTLQKAQKVQASSINTAEHRRHSSPAPPPGAHSTRCRTQRALQTTVWHAAVEGTSRYGLASIR